MDDNDKKNRKPRSDSVQEHLRIAAGAGRVIEPPENIYLDDEEMFFFDRIINEHARADWTPHMVDIASLLARQMHSLNRNSRKFSQEGELMKDAKGAIVANPRKKMIEDSMNSIISARRSLGLHARAAMGEARDIAKRSAASKAVENSVESDDFLLAKPEDFLN
jgi:hypothetical protein